MATCAVLYIIYAMLPCSRVAWAPFAPNESVPVEALCDDTGTDTRNF